jgi:peptidylprolyl isomerase
MPKRPLMIGAAALSALALAACGSSSGTSGIQTAPSAGATEAALPSQPKVPPQLAKEPVITVPKTAAPTHLVTKDLIVGTGATAHPGDTLTVNYVGALYKTGKTFDSSWSRNQPFTTVLKSGTGGVIPGWVQGLAGMKVGGRRELIIPPSLAYKNQAQGTIPANSTLIFVVDLLAVH